METQEQQEYTAARKRHRRRLLWASGLIVLLLVVALMPPLLNVSRFHSRIVASMSASLGRPVHLKNNVSFHLLPMPGLTLEDFVVSEDPAFGNEPMIRANTVEATLRISSLWRRRVEFSTIKFVEPSVNLVRSRDGRWNIEGVLVHASRVDTAPTSQPKAGPTPRFPYIEATGGRINIKLGDEKMPFSLTDADFALWLPSPQTWRVRLNGTPARTDTNIGDPGTIRVDGSLEHAEHMDEVPVNLNLSWHDAPMGEASRLLSGDDRGWRGTLHADASLQGPLATAALKLHITMDNLRRADFVPAQSLDVSSTCTSIADVPAATLQQLVCSFPNSGEKPVLVESPSVDLSRPTQAQAVVQAQQLPLQWVFEWLRLFSPRIPSGSVVPGTVDASATHAEGDPATQWNGLIAVTMPVAPHRTNGSILSARGEKNTAPKQAFEAALTTTGTAGSNNWELTLPPTPLRLGPGAEVVVSAHASDTGYGFTATGQASAAQLENIAYELPQLNDGTGLSLKKNNPAADTIRPIALTCSRPWAGGQTCVTPAPARPPAVSRHRRR